MASSWPWSITCCWSSGWPAWRLDGERKERFKTVMLELSGLAAKFEENVLDATNAFTHHVTDEPNSKASMPPSWSRRASAPSAAGKEGWLLGLDQPTYVAVVTDARSPALRQAFYRAWCTRASDQGPTPAKFDNAQVMEDLLRLRHEAAQLLDFPNYAAYALARRMARSVDEVLAFLRDMATAARPAALRELAELQEFAGRASMPGTSPSTPSDCRKSATAFRRRNCARSSRWRACSMACSA